MSLKTAKQVSLFLTIVPLFCLVMYASTNNPLMVPLAVLSVVGQIWLRRKFWKCPHCHNPLTPGASGTCPYCGNKLGI